MSVANVLAENYSVFHKTLLFFMRLAWRSRITLPYLVMIGFMVLDVRLTFEIIIDVEHQAHDESDATEADDDDDDDDEDDNSSDGEFLNFLFEE